MTGQKFGKWTVLHRTEEVSTDKRTYWICECGGCGRKFRVDGHNLRSGSTTQCRYCGYASIRGRKDAVRPNLVGKRFNMLTVLSRADNIGSHPAWRVKCERCGTEKVIREQAITSLRTKSCGCYQKQGQIEAHTKHGMARSREYGIWRSMRKRCQDPKHPSYEGYGGRGIRVCERWDKSFADFIADVGRAPSKHHQLHRKENNGNYEPNNWEWSTRTDNMRNRRNTRYIEVAGKKLPLITFCESIGISVKAVAYHLDNGKSLAEAIAIIRPVTTEVI
jgi:hypothetical protein